MPGHSANIVLINLQNCGINVACTKDIVELLSRFENLKAIDLSCNVGLGTSGAASIVECMNNGLKSMNLKGTGLELHPSRASCSFSDWARLEGALRGLAALDAIDLSDNAVLGTWGVARLLECVGSGVKSVNLKGTGLGLAAGTTTQSGSMYSLQPSRASCSDSDWARLEGALRGLAALDAIDLSDNVWLLTSGVGRLVSCCAGEESVFVGLLLVVCFEIVTLLRRELAAAEDW